MRLHDFFSKKQVMKLFVFFVLMLGNFALYSSIYQRIKSYTSTNEHTMAIDCAPIIDEHGLDKKYYLEFELKANVPGEVLVYFENGENARYAFYEYIEAGTEYKRYSMIIRPTLRDEAVKESFLGFYGVYGTGVISTVRDITFEVYKE